MLKIVKAFLLTLVFAATSLQAEESLEQFVTAKSDEILALVNEGRDSFEENPEALYGKMSGVLDELVDFDILSRGIMGKHSKVATDEQKLAFRETLRLYLIEIYTKALVNFESKSIEIIPLEKPATTKATLSMEVTTLDNATFLLAYSMAKKDAAWQVRNIIVDGINMGLTYRSQFDSMMTSNKGDMNKVIENWAEEADDDEFKQ